MKVNYYLYYKNKYNKKFFLYNIYRSYANCLMYKNYFSRLGFETKVVEEYKLWK